MPRYSEEIKQQARDMCAQGLSQSEVGRRLGIASRTVCSWVNPEVAERDREKSRRWRQENPERERENSRRWRQENLEYLREYGRQWYEENQERKRESTRRWSQENPKRKRENVRRWHQENLERVREYHHQRYQENPEHERERSRKWRQKNPERAREQKAFRRAAKRRATPPWLTPEHRKQMTALHAEARRLEKRTGIPHHVDHIIPLHAKFDGRGKQIACGLHVPWNLMVLPGRENNVKYCKLPGPEDWTAPAPSGTMEQFQVQEP